MQKYVLYSIIVCLLLISCQTKVSDNINLHNYRPFAKSSKVAILPEPATLILLENLPRISGATALYPLYAAFVQAVYPSGDYPPYGSSATVSASGTSSAYSALIRGEADLIFAARPSEDQIQRARERNITFNLTPIGKEAFVFFVNSRNSVSGLTIEQIKGIYSGRITSWNELGGKRENIIAYQRPKNSVVKQCSNQ